VYDDSFSSLALVFTSHNQLKRFIIMSDQPYYQHHVFVCINQREDGRTCCHDRGSAGIQEYAKKRLKALDMNGHGKVRMNKSGCLDRCEEGPVMVIYPEGVWYTFVDQQDVDEIIDSHLVGGKVVERLKI